MPAKGPKQYGTSRGIPVTEELIEQLVEEAERGYDVEGLRRRGGRPPLGAGPSEIVPVRLDPKLRSALDERAERESSSASEIIRRALRKFLNVA